MWKELDSMGWAVCVSMAAQAIRWSYRGDDDGHHGQRGLICPPRHGATATGAGLHARLLLVRTFLSVFFSVCLVLFSLVSLADGLLIFSVILGRHSGSISAAGTDRDGKSAVRASVMKEP